MNNILVYIENCLNNDSVLFFVILQGILLLGAILNLGFFALAGKKFNLRRVSTFFTLGIILCCIFTTLVFDFYGISETSLAENNFLFNRTLFQNSFILNIFAFLFVLLTYKLVKRSYYKVPLINFHLVNILFFSNIALALTKPVFSFVALDMVVFSIYKYASEMRLNKNSSKDCYDANFILITTAASLLFYLFSVSNYFFEDLIQKNVVQVCLVLAYLLKIGCFPFANYLTKNNLKTNLSFDILSGIYLPLIGFIVFLKFANEFNFQNNVIQLCLIGFLLLNAVFYAVFSLKAKDLSKMITSILYFFLCSAFIDLFLNSEDLAYKFVVCVCFVALALYSLLSVLKINFPSAKINLNLIKSFYFINPFFSLTLSLVQLLYLGLVPCIISISFIEILKNIYLFDEINSFLAVILIVSYFILLSTGLKVIRNIYKAKNLNKLFNKQAELFLTKRTTLNYVVLFVIIISLVVFSIV